MISNTFGLSDDPARTMGAIKAKTRRIISEVRIGRDPTFEMQNCGPDEAHAAPAILIEYRLPDAEASFLRIRSEWPESRLRKLRSWNEWPGLERGTSKIPGFHRMLTVFHADLWTRRAVFRLPCVTPASQDRPHLFVSCSRPAPADHRKGSVQSSRSSTEFQ